MGTLFVLAIALACPLMMFFMMRGLHGDAHGGHDTSHDSRPKDDPLTKYDRPPHDAGRI